MADAKIAGTGSYAPERVLTNADLSRMLGEDIDDFVSDAVGIRERHVCPPEESAAEILAVTRTTLYDKIRKYDLDPAL